MTAHALALTVHAFAAVLALVAGVAAVHTGRGVGLHRAGVLGMTVALGPSLVLGWSGFPPGARVAFVGLSALALVMVGQAVRAGRVLRREVPVAGQPVGPELVRVLGFNLIALVVAGTVVPVLRAGGGAVGVTVAVGITVGLGHLLVERRRTRTLGPQQPPSRPTQGVDVGSRV